MSLSSNAQHCANSDTGEDAWGLGQRLNKQKTAGLRKSGNRRVFAKWVPLGIACYFSRILS